MRYFLLLTLLTAPALALPETTLNLAIPLTDQATVPLLKMGNLGDSLWWKMSPTTTGTKPWFGNLRSFAGANGSSRLDNVVRWGWNCAGGGGPVDGTDTANCMEFEDDFYTGVEHQMEEHPVVFYRQDGTTHRALSYTFGKTSFSVQGASRADFFDFDGNGPGGSNYFRFNTNLAASLMLELNNGAAITKTQNNQAPLWQENQAGNAAVPLFGLNNLNQLDIGLFSVTGTPLDLRLAGNLILGSTAAKPSCDAGHETTLATVKGGAGVASCTFQCLKAADDSYSWKQLVCG